MYPTETEEPFQIPLQSQYYSNTKKVKTQQQQKELQSNIPYEHRYKNQ